MVNLDELKPYIVTPDPSDKIWLFYGEMSTRKTSVACMFPKTLLVACDIGYKLISNGNHIPCPIQSWSDFKSIVKQLDKPANHERFSTIVIDTVGMLYQMCYNYMLLQMGVSEPSEAGAYGMGWKKIRNEFETTVRSICQKGYGLIMLAHSDEVEREDKVTKKKVNSIKIDIDKRPDLIIKQLADFVFFLHKEVRDGTDIPTVYAYSNLIDIDTKSRSRYFSRRFEFTYENLTQELECAIKKQYEEQGKVMPTEALTQTNPYDQKVDFDKLKNDTIVLATDLMGKGLENDITDLLLKVCKGEKLSDLKESVDNIEKLNVIYTSLDELKTKAGL